MQNKEQLRKLEAPQTNDKLPRFVITSEMQPLTTIHQIQLRAATVRVLSNSVPDVRQLRSRVIRK